MQKEISPQEAQELNKKQRIWFVNYWADFVRNNTDLEWSRQQNVIIDSQLKGVKQLSRELYLKIKRNKHMLS